MVYGLTGSLAAPPIRTMLKASLSYGALQYIVLVMSFVKGIYIARYLGPALLGSYGLITLTTEYLRYAGLGVYSAMNLSLSAPVDDAKSAESLNNVISSAFTYALFTGAVFVFAAFVIRQWFAPLIPLEIAQYLYALCFLGFCGQFRVFTVTLARLQRRYRLINVLDFVGGGTVLVAVLLFGVRYRLDAVVGGLVLGGAITFAIGLVVAIRASEVKIRVDSIPALVALGIPLFIYVIFEHIFRTIDRLMIANWLERQDLGYFTLAYSFAASTFVLLSAFTYLAYPDFLRAYQLASNDKKEKVRVFNSFKRHTGTINAAALGLGILGMISIDPIITYFLPQYERSIGIYRILMLGMLAQRATIFSGTFLLANRHQKLLVGLAAVSIPVAVGLNLIAINFGWGVEGIAVGSAVALTFYGFLVVSAALHTINGLHLRSLGTLYGKFAMALVTIVTLLVLAPEHLYAALIAVLFLHAKEVTSVVQMVRARPVA